MSHLLNARARAGRTVVEVVADDLACHGLPVVAALREHDPAGYTRLAADLVAFKALLRAHASPDKPAPPAETPSPRERLAAQLLDAVKADFAQHGRQVLAALREANPSAYVKFVGACVQFRLLASERAPRKNPAAPRRPPRPLRMRHLVETLDRRPVDPADPRLPLRLQPRFRRMVERLGPTPWSLDALRAAWEEAGTQREGDDWDERLEAWAAVHIPGAQHDA